MCDKPQIGDKCLFYDGYVDSGKCRGKLTATTSDGRFIDGDDNIWDNCEKIKKKIIVVKKASEIIKWCEEHGYTWSNRGYMDPCGKHDLWYSTLSRCGKEPVNKRNYHEDWLEEKEV